MRNITFALLVLLSSVCFGQVKSEIISPEQVNPGDLVILDSSSSIGDNRLWVVDPRVEGKYLTFENKLVFAIGTPGSYSFQLIVADTTAAIDQTTKTIIVGKVTDPPTPDPTPDPTDPPAPAPSAIYDVSRAGVVSLNDPTTANQLYNALSSLNPLTPENVQDTIAQILRDRKGQSQNKDWLNLWRVPVNREIEKSNTDYSTSIKEAIRGLQVSDSTASPLSRLISIRMESLPGCPPCEAFKRNVEPLLPIKVEHAIATDVAPKFEIRVGNKIVHHTGGLSLQSLTKIVQSM